VGPEDAAMRAGVLVAVCVVLLFAGCGGDGVIVEGPPPPPPPTPPTLTQLQDQIFTPRCAFVGCPRTVPQPRARPAARAVLQLARERDERGARSHERVLPGHPESSYIILKLRGDPRIVGERMPFGGPYLSASDIQMVQDWIEAGAKND
jgi:hypothetical protein